MAAKNSATRRQIKPKNICEHTQLSCFKVMRSLYEHYIPNKTDIRRAVRAHFSKCMCLDMKSVSGDAVYARGTKASAFWCF